MSDRDGSGRIGKGRSAARESIQFARNLGEMFIVESGADAAAIVEFIPLEFAEQQGSKRPVLFRRRSPSPDHKLVASRAFDLDPGKRAPRDIRFVGTFRHDALKPQFATFAQDFLAIAYNMIVVE